MSDKRFSTPREIDPSTDMRETEFHEQVRDAIGFSPFERHDAIVAEIKRLRASDVELKKINAYLFAQGVSLEGK